MEGSFVFGLMTNSVQRKDCEKMAFDAIKKMAEGVPDYLEVAVTEDGLLEKATAAILALGYDMEEAIAIFLRRLIQTPHAGITSECAQEHISRIADVSLDDMRTQPLLIPTDDVFSVDLLDYATASFCTNWKPYFGTIEDIAEFRRMLWKDERTPPEPMQFESVKVYGAKYVQRDSGSYKHTNIWGFPYYVWWDKLESIHLWVANKDSYYRCVRARMTNLKYDKEENGEFAQSPGSQIWGYPHILEYRYPFHFNRMYVIEKRFDTEKELLDDMGQFDGDINLTGWLNDLYGDG